MKIIVTDPLGAGGLSILRADKNLKVDERPGIKPDELKKIIKDYDAILVRSGTKLTADIIEVPWEDLKKISDIITREIPSIVKVLYDITSKPPSTIEYE